MAAMLSRSAMRHGAALSTTPARGMANFTGVWPVHPPLPTPPPLLL